ncbi:hypothetical protein [Riemerella columbina]|uniref:hypothetical protein n=1 Tax=Riemerella columbina TaxID=103810 RepID=UPI000371DB49|nr:hypothetical protein [Riemerella columbina]
MITKDKFHTIDEEIKNSLQETLNGVKNNSLHNYIIYLANGEYISEYKNSKTIKNPYVIDYRIDYFKDFTRLDFLIKFLASYYNFPSVQTETDDDVYKISLELMIYCHIWESKPFLKRLYRLAHISNNEEYNWEVKVPDMSKHTFIRNEIKEVFKLKNNNLAGIIEKGFHSTLRNSFAHSEYHIDTMNNKGRIVLGSYSGGFPGDIKEISFDDWSERFVYSSLLSYHLSKIIQEHRNNLVSSLKTDKFMIKYPNKDGSISDRWIQYKKDDAFIFS